MISQIQQSGYLPIVLNISIPIDDSNPSWQLNGQNISISVNVMDQIKVLKQQLSQNHLGGMPINKQQLKNSAGVFLKDALTFAYYNIGNNAILEFVPKKRGRR